MIKRTMDMLGAMPRQWSGDAGYCSATNLEHVKDVEAQHATDCFISTRRMKHSTSVPESPWGRIPANATLTEQMARKLKTKQGKTVYARRKAIVEPIFGQIKTRQGKHLLMHVMEKPRGSGNCSPAATTCSNSTHTAPAKPAERDRSQNT